MRHARPLAGLLVLGFVCLGCRSLEMAGDEAEAVPEPAPSPVLQTQAPDPSPVPPAPRTEDQEPGTKDQGRRTDPEVLRMRCRFADLLLEHKQYQEARQEMELFVRDAQEMGEVALRPLIHTHSRLMDLARAEEDEYAEHLHRGIGLWLLARQRADLPEPDGELSCESLLCKAAGELAVARRLRPGDARPCWYLHLVWSRLGQRPPARRWLAAAHEHAPFSALTPCEMRGLQLALCLRDARGRVRP